jgi:6-phosphogluconolactonase
MVMEQPAMMNERGAVRISPDLARLTSTAADLFVDVARESIETRGRADIALSGGSTPRSLYQLLATPTYAGRVDWSQVHLWFGDERCVGPDDPQSNYHMAREALISHVPIPGANVRRMEGELPPTEAAQRYEEALRAAFDLAPGALPRLDLVWLGLGPDGHTASLFPDTDALKVEDRLVVANHVPQLNTDRITLTFPAINAAAVIAFLVAGEDKAARVAQVIEGDRSDPTTLLPSQRIAPVEGRLLWLLDMAAAGQLHQ